MIEITTEVFKPHTTVEALNPGDTFMLYNENTIYLRTHEGVIDLLDGRSYELYEDEYFPNLNTMPAIMVEVEMAVKEIERD